MEKLLAALNTTDEAKVREALETLRPRARKVIELRYGFKGPCLSLRKTGEAMWMSGEWARVTQKKALEKLRLALA